MATQSVSVSLGANPAGFIAGFARAGAAAEALDAKTLGLSRNLKLLGGVFIADKVVHGFVDAAKAAGDFQAKMTRLQTDANESGKNIGMVSKAILDLAGATGNTTTALADGMYKIESAGLHGAAAVNVLKAAAEGAKVGAADLTTVADALTTAMTDYHLPASKATATTNELIATVSRGKTNLEALSGSLSKVAPAAAVAHISLAQLLGAMATMTAQGTEANNAATYLRQTILQLSNPTAKARTEMENLGLSAIDVSQHLGDRGLTGTFQILTDAIQKKMGPAGTVFIKSLEEASKNTTSWQQVLANMSASQQTYVAALADMTGGTKSLQAVLELTGANAATFAKNAAEIGASTQGAGAHVKDWDVIQKNFNQRMAEARGQFEKVKIVLGQDLLPAFTAAASKLAELGAFLGRYPGLVQAVTFTLVGAGGLILSMKILNAVIDTVRGTMARTIGLRAASTGALLAEGAAADKAAGSFGRLAVAENTVGLRAPLGGALGRMGLAGAATTGGETAALGAASLTVAGALTIAGGLAVAGAVTFASVKIANWAYNSSPAARQQNAGSAPQGAGPGGTLTADQGSAYTRQYLAAAGVNPDGSAFTSFSDQVKSASDQLLSYKASEDAVAAAQDRQSLAIRGLDNDSAKLSSSLLHQAQNTTVASHTTVDLTKHLGAIAQGLADAKNKMTGFNAGLALLSDNAVSASRAEDGFQQQINNLASSLDKHSRTLKGNSNAAIQNRGLLDELVTANNQAASAVLKQSGSVEKARKTLHDNAVELERNATATFGSKKAADAFLKSIGGLPSQVDAAFAGLKDKGDKAGQDLADGFTQGMREKQAAAFAQAASMAGQAAEEMRNALQTRSPSKVTHKIGGDAASGLAKGIKDGSKHAAAEAKKAATAATTAMRDSIKDGMRDALAEWAKQVSKLKSTISKDRSALSTWRSDQAAAGSAAKGVFTATGDLSNITGQKVPGQTMWDGTKTEDTVAPVTAADINAGLSATAGKDRQFLADLKRLKALNLGAATLASLMQMGPDTGDQYAQAILAGGAGEVKTVNGYEGTINQLGNQAASQAMAPFQGHIDALKTTIEGLDKSLLKYQKMIEAGKPIRLDITAGMTQAQLQAELKKFERETGITIHLKGRTG